MMHTYGDNVKVVTSINVVLANSTQNGASVDTQRYRRAAAVIDVFTGAATTANFQLQDSPDNATWTSVTGATLGTAIVASTAAASYVINIDLAKRQRYLRLQAIGTGTAGTLCGTIHLFDAQQASVAPEQENTPITV